MATISKFYFHDASSPTAGTLPSGLYLNSKDSSGDTTNARVAKAADDVIGTAQATATFTGNASTSAQNWGWRRFVSAPLAARTFQNSDGIWNWHFARSESNLNHNQVPNITIYCWDPTGGAQRGAGFSSFSAGNPGSAGAELATSVGAAWTGASVTISDGDILVFEIWDGFTQAMATAYTSSFFYDGTTEDSTTSNAAYITPPVALTLFTGGGGGAVDEEFPYVNGGYFPMEKLKNFWLPKRRKLWVPKPVIATPAIVLP